MFKAQNQLWMGATPEPFAFFENNIFHYPYCWSELGEDCSTSKAVKYSISNTSVCGEDACEKPENIKWINNDFKFQWESEKAIVANIQNQKQDIEKSERCLISI